MYAWSAFKIAQITYIAFEPFSKNKERIQRKKFKETGDSRYIYRNELIKVSFQHDMGYVDFKHLARRTASDKLLHHKAFNIAKNPKYDGYQRDLGSMVCKSFDKKSSSLKQNEQIANKLEKPITRKF